MKIYGNQQGKTWVTILIVILAFVGAGIAVGGSLYGYGNSIRDTNIAFETRLPAEYDNNKNVLSSYVLGFYEQLGLANLKSEKMDTIIRNAMLGRFGEKGFSADGAFIAAIREAYPDISGLNAYDKILDYVKAKREEFKNTQSKLRDIVRSYESWLREGIVQSWIIANILHAPTDRLVIKAGETVYRGRVALDKIAELVIDDTTADAYQVGRMKPLSAK